MSNPSNTRVVVNTFPEMHLAERLTEYFGCTPCFGKAEGKPVFQAQLFFRVNRWIDNELLYEFRTSSDWFIDTKIEDNDFYPKILSLLLESITHFDWYMKGNKSYLTMGKPYTPLPTITDPFKKFIAGAYMMDKLGLYGKSKD